MLAPLRGLVVGHEPSLISSLRTLHSSSGLTGDHVQRIRRWSPRVAELWDSEIAQPAQARDAVRDVLDLPPWIQPAVARMLFTDEFTTAAEAIADISTTN
jgi:hypothetical protein